MTVFAGREPPAITNWKQPDSYYRFPVLEIRLGDEILTTAPPTYVREMTLTMTDTGLRGDFELNLFDETWVKIPELMRLNPDEERRSSIGIRFGWPFEGGTRDEWFGNVDTVTMNLGTEGVEYLMRGRINGNTVLDISKPLPKTFPNLNRGALAEFIAQEYYNIPVGSSRLKIEPTEDVPENYDLSGLKGIGDMKTFLETLAADAKPKEKVVLPDMKEAEQKGLYKYSFKIDQDGNFRFHPPASNFTIEEQPITIYYPYPAGGQTPVLEMAVASVQFKQSTIVTNKINPETGAEITIEAAPDGESDGTMNVRTRPAKEVEAYSRMAQAQANMSEYVYQAEATVLGNVHLRAPMLVDVKVNAPQVVETGVDTFLDGRWFLAGVVHAINAEGFVTRLVLKRSFSS